MLECFTCVKLLKSSACLDRAVRAATAELESGIAPAVFNSAGCRKFSILPPSSSSATSVTFTWKILATQAQIDSGVLPQESKLASCSICIMLLEHARAEDDLQDHQRAPFSRSLISQIGRASC